MLSANGHGMQCNRGWESCFICHDSNIVLCLPKQTCPYKMKLLQNLPSVALASFQESMRKATALSSGLRALPRTFPNPPLVILALPTTPIAALDPNHRDRCFTSRAHAHAGHSARCCSRIKGITDRLSSCPMSPSCQTYVSMWICMTTRTPAHVQLWTMKGHNIAV